MGLIFILIDRYFVCIWVMEFIYIFEEIGWYIINVREIFYDENGWLFKYLLLVVYVWFCLFI